MAETNSSFDLYPFLKELGLQKENPGCYYDGKWEANGALMNSVSPHNNEVIAQIRQATEKDYENCIDAMNKGKSEWMTLPIPQRGEIVRQIGQSLRDKKKPLGQLISLEMGKILSEGEGEVQEFVDICDFACGLSRMLEGKIIPSERANHYMLEMWNPLGLIGVITAFNFPCAVLGWNLAIAMICGDLTVWKGASSTSLVTIATTRIIAEVLERNKLPSGILTTVIGSGKVIGEVLINDKRLQMISFTGSSQIGQRVSEIVHKRFGRTILELGGNNAMIVMEDANLELALKGCVFSAVGTCGQRCTSLRRLLVHESHYEEVCKKLQKVYETIQIGDPLEPKTLCGPLHTKSAVNEYFEGIQTIISQGGKILYGGKVVEGNKSGNYVYPTLVEIDGNAAIVKDELFVPILYLIKFKTLEEAIHLNNNVPQGLSSSMFTKNLQNLFQWVGPLGSDCGIVNCNIGPSGAFGGEKETGGGRESGSDSWKQYMRRSTCTINFGNALPLAQGVKFDI